MAKILGLDLGTKSIGWAMRDLDSGNGSKQITGKGAVIFEKGVGEGKSGEFSLAAERTKNRQSRKKYSRRRWRKMDLLKILIDENVKMCPLPESELKQWGEPKKKSQRVYPKNETFINWLRLDFNNDGAAEYENPYELRTIALTKKLHPEELGRVFY